LVFVFVFMFFEIERDVKENEREKESFTCWLLGFDEKHVKKKKDERRSMQIETEENRAIEKQNTSFFSWFFCFCFFIIFGRERLWNCEWGNWQGMVWG
jgi:hypothetical protein